MNNESPPKAGDEQKDRLLNEFEYPTYEQWKEAAEKMLKGAPFEKRLLTKTYEGITLKPIYDADDIKDLGHMGGMPGSSDYVRGTEVVGSKKEPWGVCQEILCDVPKDANEALKMDLARGQSAIRLGLQVATADELAVVLEGIDLADYPMYLNAGVSGLSTLAMLVAHAKKTGVDLSTLKGAVENAPLEDLAQDGILSTSLGKAYDEMAASTMWAAQHAPSLKTISVGAHATHDAGGSAVEELAFAIACGVEYMREMQARGLDVDTIASKMNFSFSVRGDFFMEVAKLRAARLMWSKVIKEFGGKDESGKMALNVRTSKWSKSVTDPYVNMIRATTETFSAVVGGAENIQTAPFDEPFRYANDFSRRIARNVQTVLREESHVGEVVDPAGGSYFVEKLTDELASKAWGVFQEVEKQGGMSKSLAKGFPQNKLSDIAGARFKDFASRKNVIVGTNMYANVLEKPLSDEGPSSEERKETRNEYMRNLITDPKRRDRVQPLIEKLKEVSGNFDGALVDVAVEAAQGGAFIGEIRGAVYGTKDWGSIEIEPFDIHRASVKYEVMRESVRLFAVLNGSAPKVFLANMGPIPQHKPRADFTRGFFEVGGFDVIGNNGFENPEAAAQAALASGASISVVCSTDPTYPELVPPFVKAVKEKAPNMKVILAGYPKDQIEAHKESGVDGFIHLRANNFQMLTELLVAVGVAI